MAEHETVPAPDTNIRVEGKQGQAEGLRYPPLLEQLGLGPRLDAQALRAGGPWGQAFPEPSFDGIFSIRSARVIGERHVKMWVEPAASGRAFDAVAFNHLEEGAGAALPSGLVQLVYRLDVNEYQGERRLQLLIDHLLPVAR